MERAPVPSDTPAPPYANSHGTRSAHCPRGLEAPPDPRRYTARARTTHRNSANLAPAPRGSARTRPASAAQTWPAGQTVTLGPSARGARPGRWRGAQRRPRSSSIVDACRESQGVSEVPQLPNHHAPGTELARDGEGSVEWNAEWHPRPMTIQCVVDPGLVGEPDVAPPTERFAQKLGAVRAVEIEGLASLPMRERQDHVAGAVEHRTGDA